MVLGWVCMEKFWMKGIVFLTINRIKSDVALEMLWIGEDQ